MVSSDDDVSSDDYDTDYDYDYDDLESDDGEPAENEAWAAALDAARALGLKIYFNQSAPAAARVDTAELEALFDKVRTRGGRGEAWVGGGGRQGGTLRPSLRGVWAYALCAQEAASAVQHAARRGARACSSRDRCSRSAIAAHPVRSARAHRAAGGGVCILRSPRPNNRRCCSHLPR